MLSLLKKIFSVFIFFFFFQNLGFCFSADSRVGVIEIYNKNGKVIGKEAGVFISGDKLLTHYYVFSAVKRAVVRAADEEFEIKGICGRNYEKRLLQVRINGSRDLEKIVFSKCPVQKEEIFVLLPGGKKASGRIVETVETGERLKIELDSPVERIRGLPVFDKEGRLRGVIEFFTREENVVYAICVCDKVVFEDLGLLTISEWEEMRRKEWMMSDEGKRQTVMYVMHLGQYETAAAMMEELLAEKPDDKEAYFKLGVCYGKLEKYKEAAGAYKKYLSFAPEDFKAHYNLGIAYLGMGDLPAAKREYEFLKNSGSKEAAVFAERLLEYIKKGKKP